MSTIKDTIKNIFNKHECNFDKIRKELKKMKYGTMVHQFEEQETPFMSVFTLNNNQTTEYPFLTGAVFNSVGDMVSYTGDKTNDNILKETDVVSVEDDDKLVIEGATMEIKFPVNVYQYQLGTRIVFYNSGTLETPVWRIATSKTVDAFSSKWNTDKSFGDMCMEVIETKYYITFEEFTQNFDSKCCYHFVMVHPSISHVSDNMDQGMFYTGGYDMTTMENLPLDCNVLTATKLSYNSYNSYDELLPLLEEIKQGLNMGIILNDSTHVSFKFLNETFFKMINSKCVTHNVVEEYFKNRNNAELLEMYKLKFPEQKLSFEGIENTIKKIVNILHKTYVSKYPMHMDVGILPKPMDVFLRHVIHKRYRDTKEKITKQIVMDLFDFNEKYKH